MNADVSDLRQQFAVMKNEIKKFMFSRKLIVFFIVMVLIGVQIFAAVMYQDLKQDQMTDQDSVAFIMLQVASFMTLLCAVLFSSTSIVSEFQDRTALILFVRPVRKWAIYLGKFAASFLVSFVFLGVYYVIAAIACVQAAGAVSSHLLQSFGAVVAYIFAITGISFLVSQFQPKASTSMIMVLVLFLIVFSVVSVVVHLVDENATTWWLVSTASEQINLVFPGVEPYDDYARDIAVMAVWGVVTAVAGYLGFGKRDFRTVTAGAGLRPPCRPCRRGRSMF